MAHDQLFLLRDASSVVRMAFFVTLAIAFWRFRLQSDFRSVCLALTVQFSLAALGSFAHLVTRYTGGEAQITIVELSTALISGACTWSIIKSV